jgi:hypothetical protein
MPVGLNLVEKVEERLLEEGLLPADSSVVHRVIDFSRSDFTLRWTAAETGGRTVEVRMRQQLAQRTLERPVVSWRVVLEGEEDGAREGRVLLTDRGRTTAVAAAIAGALQQLLKASSPASTESAPSSPEGDSSFP